MNYPKVILSWIFLCMTIIDGWSYEKQLKVHLRGVYDAKITITPFNGVKVARPLRVFNGVKSGETVQTDIPGELLPGEFLLRFDYRKKETDNSYPSELQLYLNNEDIEIYVNPLYTKGDSLKLENDRENTAWERFSVGTAHQLRQIGLLEQLLAAYDRPNSTVWKKAATEYTKRTASYNQWVDSAKQADNSLYVSHLYYFSHIAPVDWKLPDDKRFEKQVNEWFDGFDFNDTLVIRSPQMNQFVTQYVNQFGSRATTEMLRDSLFTMAGQLAIGLASAGHPKMYGWMTDYFYNGYESYNITAGLRMLERHINNPRCLTIKKQSIISRLEGMKKIVPGVQAPNVTVTDIENHERMLNFSSERMGYHLLMFYDAECGHCNELLDKLQSWYSNPANKAWIDVYTVSIDNSRKQWEAFHKKKSFAWNDMYADGGINSQAANDYYILSAPQMFVMNNDGQLVAMPGTVKELDNFLFGK